MPPAPRKRGPDGHEPKGPRDGVQTVEGSRPSTEVYVRTKNQSSTAQPGQGLRTRIVVSSQDAGP